MKRLILTMVPLAVCVLITGCGEDASNRLNAVAPAPSDDIRNVETLARLARSADGGVGALSASAHIIVLPAGSADALGAAVAAAGPGGAVILRSGLHTESHGTTITQSVSLIGEPGAVLQVDSHADPADFVMDPALHIRNTSNVVIWGLEIRPVGAIGGAAILVERAPRLVIANNRIYDHQNAIMIAFTDETLIWGNRIVVTGAWLTGDVAEADGITCTNGRDVRVIGNDISNGFFGVFASGRSGVFVGNRLSGNYIGVIFCRVPANVIQLPSGETFGSLESANRWSASDNSATGNFNVGYLVIDGANLNTLTRNAGSGNGAYDIELVGESTRFGFCTPTSFQNTVRSTGRYAAVSIKDCGLNNMVVGGHQVDTSIDPCDPVCPPQAAGRLGAASARAPLAAALLEARPIHAAR